MAGSLRLALELALTDNATGGLRQITDSLKKMGAEGVAASERLSAGLAKVEQGYANLARARDLAETLKPMVDKAAELEDALSRLKVELDLADADKDLEAFRVNAARVAGPTQFNIAEMVDISTELKKSGLSTGDILGKGGAAEATAALATADKTLSREDAQSAMISAGAIFNLEGSEFSRLADLLTRSAAAGATSTQELTAAIENSQAAGMLDPREVLGAFALASNVGLKGPEAGTALTSMLNIGAQKSSKDERVKQVLFNNDGSYRELTEMAEHLQTVTARMTEQQRAVFLNESFGEGGRFAGILAKGGLEGTLASMEDSQGLEQRIASMNSTFTARADALGGSLSALIANVFTPALEPLGQLATKANELTGSFDGLIARNPALSKAISYGGLGAVGVAGAVGAARVARGGFDVMGGLKQALRGQGGVVGGLIGAKAAEAAGITPVFVTNWPAGGPELPGNPATTASTAAKGGLGARAALNALPGAAAVNGLWAGGAAKAALGTAGGVALAGAAGYGVGTLINDHAIRGTAAADGLQRMMAKMNLFFDSMATKVGMEGMSETERARMMKEFGIGPAAQPPIKVDIKVDAQGQATAEVRMGADVARTAVRGA